MSNDKHKEFIASLQELKLSPGWKVIEKVLKANIKDVENDMFNEDLNDEDPAKEMKRLSGLRKERNERKTMLNLPDDLIKLYADPVNFEKDFDPFD